MSGRIAVIIPALNAAGTIATVVTAARAETEPVVVVDDGSNDGTGEVARTAGATVLRHDVNRGKGAALKSGFAWALANGFNGVITLDADGQHLPSEIPTIVDAQRATEADLVIGGRAHLFAQMLPRRRMANRFSAWSIARASGRAVTDSQSGFRYYSERLIRTLDLRSDGFDMESEVIILAGRAGLTVTTVAIELGFVDGISTSHYRPVLDTLRIAGTVLRARFLRR